MQVILIITLFFLPLVMGYALLTKVSSDMWTLVIIFTWLVTIVQIMGSLATYVLYVWVSLHTVPSPNMDDYVYYAKVVTRGWSCYWP